MPGRRETEIQRLCFLVGIPIPSQDRDGCALKKSEVEKWTARTSQTLTDCFGGATPLPAPSTNRVGTRVIFEKGQVLVLSACKNRNEYLSKQLVIGRLAQDMKESLNQYAVIVLAFPSDSFLVVDKG